MGSEKNQREEGDADYLSSFESSDRRRKRLLIVVAIVFALLVVGGFLMTLGSLGRLGEHVDDVFEEGVPAGSQNAPTESPAPGQTPSQ